MNGSRYCRSDSGFDVDVGLDEAFFAHPLDDRRAVAFVQCDPQDPTHSEGKPSGSWAAAP